MVLTVSALVSGLAFVYYGLGILTREHLRHEFARYRLPHLRVMVGILELLGAAGVLLGLAHPPLGALAAAGLCLLMLLGLRVRLTLRDSARQMVPAASLAVLNAVLVGLFLTA